MSHMAVVWSISIIIVFLPLATVTQELKAFREGSIDPSGTPKTYSFYNNKKYKTYSIKLECENATRKNPLFMRVQLPLDVLSVQLPIVLRHAEYGGIRYSYQSVARTLCPQEISFSTFNVTINSGVFPVESPEESPMSLNYNLTVKPLTAFDLRLDTPLDLSASAPEPVYLRFQDNNLNEDEHLRVVIDSSDDICMTVFIQPLVIDRCPMFHYDENIASVGIQAQTITRRGAIPVNLDTKRLGKSFYVAFIVKPNPSDCSGIVSPISGNDNNTAEPIPSTAVVKNFTVKLEKISEPNKLGYCIPLFIVGFAAAVVFLCTKIIGYGYESENDPSPRLNNIDQSSAMAARSETELHAERHAKEMYRQYIVIIVPIASYFFIAVFQLVFHMYQVYDKYGNTDACWFNFRCMHRSPKWVLAVFHLQFEAFNNVFSNSCYILLGCVLLVQVWRRENAYNQAERKKGIPFHSGPLYAGAAALIMEGFFSLSFHTCPNRVTYQFDTAFMYMIAALLMIEIYRHHHPETPFHPGAFYVVMAVTIFFSMFRTRYESWWFFDVIFFVIYFILLILVASKFLCNMEVGRVLGIENHGVQIWGHFWLVIAAMFSIKYLRRCIAIWTFLTASIFGAMMGYFVFKDFPSMILSLFLFNLGYLIIYHLASKYVYDFDARDRNPVVEKARRRHIFLTILYLTLSAIFFAIGLAFFTGLDVSQWRETPAISRNRNDYCMWLFYDAHDLWHMSSALGLFFAFNAVMCIDDNLCYKDREHIAFDREKIKRQGYSIQRRRQRPTHDIIDMPNERRATDLAP